MGTGGEELGGYDTGEETEGISRFGGEEGGARRFWVDFDRKGVSGQHLDKSSDVQLQ